MNWSDEFRRLSRGIRIGASVARSGLAPRRREPWLYPPDGSRVLDVTGFGDNPAGLRMLVHLPPGVSNSPLVVLLHGCGQRAAGFAAASGWIELADRLRFPLLMPEQSERNNPSRCFRWYQPADATRDHGEAASLAAMTRTAITRFGCDPSCVFILGLSAGAAMTAAMLAAYPDLFAAGATVAGLPVGVARSGLQAVRFMTAAAPDRPVEDWVQLMRGAAPAGYAGPWPRLSVWQGQADTTVAPGNADLLVAQWRALHGLNGLAMAQQIRAGVVHRAWSDGKRRMVELWSIPNFGHAYPTGTRVSPAARFVTPAAVDATATIAKFFGLE